VKRTLAVDLGAGLVLPTPVVVASGCAGTGRELGGLVDLRKVGAVVSRSITLEPDRASAHAGCALTDGMRALQDQLPPAEAEARVRDATRRALELDPTLPTAQLAHSLTRLLFDWDAAGAVAEARAAVAADPEDLRGPIVLALALQAEGRLGDAEHVLDRATVHDPYSTAAFFLRGRIRQMGAELSDR